MEDKYQETLSEIKAVIKGQKEMTESSPGEEPMVGEGEDFPEVSFDFSKRGLSDLPKEIIEVKNIVGLDLSDNNLSSLPDWFQSLSTIKFLDLRNNKLNCLPEWFEKMASLKILDLRNNEINTIPKYLSDFEAAGHIDFSESPQVNNVNHEDNLVLRRRKEEGDKEAINEKEKEQDFRGLFLYGNPLNDLPEKFRAIKENFIEPVYIENYEPPPNPLPRKKKRTSRRIRIFVSYSHAKKDESYIEDCIKCLETWERNSDIDLVHWSDKKILPGTDWFEEIKRELEDANAVFFLVSVDFLHSVFIRKNEMSPVLAKLKKREVKKGENGISVFSIILRPCSFFFKRSPLAVFQALPKDGKPISSFTVEEGGEDEAWNKVFKKVEEVFESKYNLNLSHP